MIFGSLHHSIFYVANLLEQIVPDIKVSILDPSRKFRKAKIYLAPSILSLQKFQSEIQGKRGVVILFENPVILAEIKNIRYLDGKQIPGASYRFKFHKLSQDMLQPVISAVAKKTKIDINRQKLDVLPNLIKVERAGKFLDKFNSMIYFGLGIKDQNRVRHELVNYLYRKKPLKTFENLLNELFTSTRGKEYAKRVIDFLKSEQGQNLYNATTEFAKRYNSRPNTKKKVHVGIIAKMHKTDKSELIYLGQLFRREKLDPIKLVAK